MVGSGRIHGDVISQVLNVPGYGRLTLHQEPIKAHYLASGSSTRSLSIGGSVSECSCPAWQVFSPVFPSVTGSFLLG
jgi:hypothetical protein